MKAPAELMSCPDFSPFHFRRSEKEREPFGFPKSFRKEDLRLFVLIGQGFFLFCDDRKIRRLFRI